MICHARGRAERPVAMGGQQGPPAEVSETGGTAAIECRDNRTLSGREPPSCQAHRLRKRTPSLSRCPAGDRVCRSAAIDLLPPSDRRPVGRRGQSGSSSAAASAGGQIARDVDANFVTVGGRGRIDPRQPRASGGRLPSKPNSPAQLLCAGGGSLRPRRPRRCLPYRRTLPPLDRR